VRFAAIVVAALALSTGLVPAHAAVSDDVLSIPFRGSQQSALPKGWTVTACPTGRTPDLVTVRCDDRAVTFTAAGFDRGVGTQKVVIALRRGSETRAETYRVTLAPPTLSAPAPAFHDVPLAQGSLATIPYSELPATCGSCTTTGPTFAGATVTPARAGAASFGPRGIVFQSAPDFSGRATIHYRIDDPVGQRSAATSVEVAVVPGMTHAPTIAGAAARTAKNAAVSGSAVADDTVPSGYPITLSRCGQPQNGSVECKADGTFVYHPDTGFTGIDQFSYFVYADRSGDQAVGSVVVGVGRSSTNNPARVLAAEPSREAVSPLTPPRDTDQNG
jgi:hypothetical protein